MALDFMEAQATFSDSNSQVPAFPARQLTAVLMTTLFTLILIGVAGYTNRMSTEAFHERATELRRMSSQIAFENEVLSMSARMVASTGQSYWTQRYDTHLQIMNKALQTANASTGTETYKKHIKAASTANDKLVQIAVQARRLSQKGDTKSATLLIDSPEYLKQKSNLENATKNIEIAINASVQAEREKLSRDTAISLASRLALLLIVIGSWIWFPYRLRLWRQSMDEFINQEHEISLENARERERITATSAENQMLLQQHIDRVQSENDQLTRAAREQEMSVNRRVADAFETTVGNIADQLGKMSGGLVGTARAMENAARNTDSQFVEMTTAIEASSADMLAVATTTDQLVASVREASQHAAISANHLINATAEAGELVDHVRHMANVADQIGMIVGLIRGIAGQTNMLALNASIEASRAGEAGSGFAVVAQEIKNLASATAKATADVSELVAKVQSGTNAAVKSGSVTSDSMARIQAAAHAIGEVLDEQEVAIAQLSVHAGSVVASNAQISVGINVVSSTAREAGEASTDVLDAANMLSSQTHELKAQINTVVNRLRAET
ncbi:MAG: methyl-accepting chemotaxis protein [Sphingorhabdus sp.]